MRSPATAAALCAAFLSFLPAARGQDLPLPEGHAVLEPPGQPLPPADWPAPPPPAQPPPSPPAQPSSQPARPAPRASTTELGFQLRLGMAEQDRFAGGASFVVNSGPATFGLSTDVIADVGGSHEHHTDGEHGGWSHWCEVQPDGRCLARADVALSGFAGLRHRGAPVAGGPTFRFELVGELGWQLSYVEEQLQGTGMWSDGSRSYPFAGARAGLGVMFFGHGYFGVGGFAHQSLGSKVCVPTAGGCTEVGGLQAGVYLFGGGEWGVGH